MADNIQIKAGNKAGMPTLNDREPAYVRDEEALYIGTPGGNKKVCSAKTEGKVSTLEKSVQTLQTTVSGKLTATQMEAQADIAAEADLAAVIAGYNGLLAAMRTSGIIKIEETQE